MLISNIKFLRFLITDDIQIFDSLTDDMTDLFLDEDEKAARKQALISNAEELPELVRYLCQ